MPRKSIIPEILAVLEPYLERMDTAWESQLEDRRQPTLPITSDGKVNVRQLVRELGLRETQEQHFFKHPELAALVNAVAVAQGVKPIGSRALDDVADKVMADRLRRVQTQSSDLAKILAEREAVIERQRREILSLREQLRLLEEAGMVLRTGGVD